MTFRDARIGVAEQDGNLRYWDAGRKKPARERTPELMTVALGDPGDRELVLKPCLPVRRGGL